MLSGCPFKKELVVEGASFRNKENSQEKCIVHHIRDKSRLKETVSWIFLLYSIKENKKAILLKSGCTLSSYHFSLSTFVRKTFVIYFLEN